MTIHGYAALVRDIEDAPEFWAELLTAEFTEELARLMDEESVNRKQLAERVGVQPSYITRVLNGDANFTALTMARLAHALGARVAVHLAPKEADVRWVDLWNNDLPSPFQPTTGHRARYSTSGTGADRTVVNVCGWR